MSSREILHQVKAMSARQRQEFVQAVLELDEPVLSAAPAGEQRVKWPDVEARARRIFGRRTLPNLVLLERDDEGGGAG